MQVAGRKNGSRKVALAVVAATLLVTSLSAAEARASTWWGGFRAPMYHPPSMHYDQVYHQDFWHWTPYRGFHSYGHYDPVPHYVPPHFDRWHNGHIHLNP